MDRFWGVALHQEMSELKSVGDMRIEADVGSASPPEDAAQPLPQAWVATLRSTARRKLWPISLFFLGLASLSTVSSSFGDLIRDNRFEQFVNPPRRIAKTLTLWDGSRGLGRVREDFWPGTTGPLALLRGLGFSSVMAQKIWLALVLVLLGVGTVAVVRLFRPRIGPEHLIAGLAAMFGVFSATFLVPSNLAFQAALAPWFVVALWRGVRETRPWRWAAVFALLVFLGGNADLPGLIFSMVPLLPAVIYLVVVERSVRIRDIVAWLARAALLCVLISAAAAAKTLAAATTLDQRLVETESPAISSVTSSWSESFRGLGNWLSYFQQSNTMVKPQGAPYFLNPVVILATFVPGIVALAVVWRSRWRPRILMIWMAIVALTVMVGAYPLTRSSPVGSAILDAVTNVSAFQAFRNLYKAGAGLVLGISVLFGVGAALAVKRATAFRPAAGRVSAAGVVFVLLAGAVPFWTGGLFDGDRSLSTVPTYWVQTFSYLDAKPVDGRVLILPSSSRTNYRWGSVSDDIFDAMLTRDHVVATGVPLSTPLAANLIEAITATASDPSYQPGSLATILRRLGVTEVVLRNDLDWQDMGRPRPALYEGLRFDPTLRLAASFGDPGQNTTAPEDTSPDAVAERELPPVEVYEIADPRPELRADSARPPTVVSGDGMAWPSLATAGLLTGTSPVQYSGSLDDSGLTAAFATGAPLVVTDTNRRRLRVVVGHDPDYSYLLSAGQDLDRPTQSLFPDPATQSRAWYPDATSITLSGNPRSFDGSEPWNQPSNAFDGDPETQWVMRRAQVPQGRTFRIELRNRRAVDRIKVDLADRLSPASSVRQLRLKFSEGPDVILDLTGSTTEVDFGGRVTSFIDVEILAVAPGAVSVGFADIVFPGLDLRQFVEVPTDVAEAAARDESLRSALAVAPVSYLFARDDTAEPRETTVTQTQADEAQQAEVALRRRFRTVDSRSFGIRGVLHLNDRATEDQLIALLGSVAPAVVDGEANALQSPETSLPDSCQSIGLELDGTDVPVRLSGTVGALLASEPVSWTACRGRHGAGREPSAGHPQQSLVRPGGVDRFGVGRSDPARRATLGDHRPLPDIHLPPPAGRRFRPAHTLAGRLVRRTLGGDGERGPARVSGGDRHPEWLADRRLRDSRRDDQIPSEPAVRERPHRQWWHRCALSLARAPARETGPRVSAER